MSKYKIQISFYLITVSLFLVNCSRSDIPLQNDKEFLLKEKTLQKPTSLSNMSPSPNKNWQVAIFHGLVMGKSKVDDLRKVLGEPLQIADLTSVGDKNHLLYHYESKEKIIGKIVVWVNKKTQIIGNIELRPDSMSKMEALEYFGEDYIITRYSSSDCPEATFDSTPLYEEPNGEIKFIEYRDKGIAILISEDNTVQYISYLSEPIGSELSKCK